MNKKINLMIYMPALNEEDTIQDVLANLPKSIYGIDNIVYLVIDDGSTDRTSELAKATGAHVISHFKNIGVGGAFHTAVRYALENQIDILVGIDADRQFDPNEIPMMVKPIVDNQADMVIGNRFSLGRPENMDIVKYLGNKMVTKLLSRICNQEFSDVSCGYRVFSREALMWFNLFGAFTYTHETILSLVFHGKRVIEQPVKILYHKNRKSRIAKSIFAYAINTSKIILNTVLDYKPIMFFGTLGGGSIAAGVIIGIGLVVRYLIMGSFSPYKYLGFISLTLIIFGMLMYLVAILTNIFKRLRLSQEELLFQIKLLRLGK